MSRSGSAIPLLMFSPALLLGATASASDGNAGESGFNAGMRGASIETQGDDAHNRMTMAALSLTLGNHWWIHGGGGRSRSEIVPADTSETTDVIESTLVRGGIGFATEHWQYTLDFNSHSNGDNYTQRDWSGSLGWGNARFGIGLDAMSRTTETRTAVTGQFGQITQYVKQSLDGHGFGLHADINLTARLNLFAGGMFYSYGDVSSDHPALARLLSFGGSGITREQAILDNSAFVGLGFQAAPFEITAQYLRDAALDSGEITHTVQLRGRVSLGDHWTLMPMVGTSSSESFESVTYGGLSVGFGW